VLEHGYTVRAKCTAFELYSKWHI